MTATQRTHAHMRFADVDFSESSLEQEIFDKFVEEFRQEKGVFFKNLANYIWYWDKKSDHYDDVELSDAMSVFTREQWIEFFRTVVLNPTVNRNGLAADRLELANEMFLYFDSDRSITRQDTANGFGYSSYVTASSHITIGAIANGVIPFFGDLPDLDLGSKVATNILADIFTSEDILQTDENTGQYTLDAAMTFKSAVRDSGFNPVGTPSSNKFFPLIRLQATYMNKLIFDTAAGGKSTIIEDIRSFVERSRGVSLPIDLESVVSNGYPDEIDGISDNEQKPADIESAAKTITQALSISGPEYNAFYKKRRQQNNGHKVLGSVPISRWVSWKLAVHVALFGNKQIEFKSIEENLEEIRQAANELNIDSTVISPVLVEELKGQERKIAKRALSLASVMDDNESMLPQLNLLSVSDLATEIEEYYLGEEASSDDD